VRLVPNEEIGEKDYNIAVSSYVEQRDEREEIDIKKLNAEIARIVTRQSELRTQIDAIVTDLDLPAGRQAGGGTGMTLENNLNITSQVELAKVEEKISKQKARQLFDTGDIDQVNVGTFAGLAFIHAYLFDEIYEFAGKMREVNIAKGNFRFAPVMYLAHSLKYIDTMPQSNFDEIIEKYVEMNIAHPFREGNGRATRIWLDLILKKEIRQVIDWNKVDKDEYLSAMERSPVKDIEIKVLLKGALTDQINDRALFMKGIDVSYYYEGYSEFKTEEL
jgi:cell filamentation protein